ncbi:MAG: ACT domain-containing protein [Pseudomonadota bacterium]
MKETLILTVIGPDHTGIVNRVSETISAHGGNWHESRMAHLAGQFAGLMRAQVPAGNSAGLRAALGALSEEDLQITVVTESSAASVEATDHQTLGLSVTGSDQPGIVRDITGVLARHGVNVEELTTEVSPAPMSSHELFIASAKMNAGADVDLDALQHELESLSHDLMIELSVQL